MRLRKKYQISCATCNVRKLCLAKDSKITPFLDQLIPYVKIYQPGEHCYLQQEKMDYIFAVYSGLVKDYSIDQEGNEYINEFYFPGDMIGLELANKSHFKSNAVAIKETTMCLVPIADILSNLDTKYLSLKRRLFDILCETVQERNLFHLTTNAKSRVASFYLHIISREKKRDPWLDQIPLAMTNIDISNKLGIAHETLSRILHEFKATDIINIEQGRIASADLPALKRIAHVL